ncbi:hypothetical protein, partial [Mycobacterium tuberculosis]|uniref:hypothetical protein n=1 Tax=Mycobacterium tuberculosis TaxID=1773 RepID=UPI0039BE66EA
MANQTGGPAGSASTAKTVRTGDGPACPPGAAVANELPTSAAGSTGAAALATDITAVAAGTAVA